MTRADDLFALVVANLADNAPRAVLADHWMELGDPRGEFVALQLKVNRGEGNRTDRERMTQLKQRHETEWLGALRSAAGFALFQRGFLDELHLAPAPDAAGAASRSRELGTVRFLRRGSMFDGAYRAFLFSPALVNVRSADVPLDLLYEVLAHPPATLRRIALDSSASIRLDEHVGAVQRILAGARFEEVAVSVPSGEDIRPYFTGSFAARDGDDERGREHTTLRLQSDPRRRRARPPRPEARPPPRRRRARSRP